MRPTQLHSWPTTSPPLARWAGRAHVCTQAWMWDASAVGSSGDGAAGLEADFFIAGGSGQVRVRCHNVEVRCAACLPLSRPLHAERKRAQGSHPCMCSCAQSCMPCFIRPFHATPDHLHKRRPNPAPCRSARTARPSGGRAMALLPRPAASSTSISRAWAGGRAAAPWPPAAPPSCNRWRAGFWRQVGKGAQAAASHMHRGTWKVHIDRPTNHTGRPNLCGP